MALQESGEMYLETIYVLSQKSNTIRGIDIGEHMGFSKPSVSRALGLLKDEGLIKKDKDGYIALTKAGEILALCCTPRVTYELSCVDLYPETGDPSDLILPGKAVKVIDGANNISVTAVCESVSKSDAWNRPGEMSVTLRTGTRRQKSLIETLADKALETGSTTLG